MAKETTVSGSGEANRVGRAARCPWALALGALLLLGGCPLKSDTSKGGKDCIERLRHLGTLLAARKAGGLIKMVEGSAFLLQCQEDMTESELVCFRCPSDFRDFEREVEVDGEIQSIFRTPAGKSACSYRGPDGELLRLLSSADAGKTGSFIIACDMCGSAGTVPHHREGLGVLWSDWRAEIIPWPEVEGYKRQNGREEFGTIVGPDGSDPRLRHLIQ